MTNRQNPEFVATLNKEAPLFGRSGRLFINSNPEDVYQVDLEQRGNFKVFNNGNNFVNTNINVVIAQDTNSNDIFDAADLILTDVPTNEIDSDTIFFEQIVDPGTYFIEVQDDGLTDRFGQDALSAYIWTASYSPDTSTNPNPNPDPNPDPNPIIRQTPIPVDLNPAGDNSDVVAGDVGSFAPVTTLVNKVYQITVPKDGALAVVNTSTTFERFLSTTTIPPEGSSIALTNRAIAKPTSGISFTLASDTNNNGLLDSSDQFHDFEDPNTNVAGTVIFNKSVSPGTYFVEVNDTNGSSSSLDRFSVFYDPGGTGLELDIIADPRGEGNELPPDKEILLTETEFLQNPSLYMKDIKDFDGNNLGSSDDWKKIGSIDVQGDGDIEHIFVNPVIGRWATVGVDRDTLTGQPQVDFANHGLQGDTRVVGIYEDPLIAIGQVEKGSDFDSQRRFQNDLYIDNLILIPDSGMDYDGDGLQEIYFKVNDGTAVLHALMHADGNIQYANYQSELDLEQFMTENEIASSVWSDWF